MTDILEFLKKEGISGDLLDGVSEFRAAYPAAGEKQEGRVPFTPIMGKKSGKRHWPPFLRERTFCCAVPKRLVKMCWPTILHPAFTGRLGTFPFTSAWMPPG